jgi:hypothetical protein
VQASAPVKQYWSATAYDRATHALIRKLPWSGRSSQTPGLQKNADGSVDIYCAPKAPKRLESNWIPTVPGRNWFSYFRLYEPTQPYFDRAWPLGDFEKIRPT